MKTSKWFLMGAMMLFSLTTWAQRQMQMNLWTTNMPNDNGNKNDTAKVQVFLPNEKNATGRAVVIMPGGGYEYLSLEKEGSDWAPFLNNMGIAAIVLKYRMPNGNPEVPVSDAYEAMSLVRRNAKNWHINPNDVGVMGFSAGGI